MKPHASSLSLLLAIALALTGCCSPQVKRQRAYDKYVKKSAQARQKQQAIMRPAKPEMPPQPEPGEFVESVQLESGSGSE